MPCFRWVYDLNTETVHAIATNQQGSANALCGRSIERYSKPGYGQPTCNPCRSRDEDIHKHADHKSKAPQGASATRRLMGFRPRLPLQTPCMHCGATTPRCARWHQQLFQTVAVLEVLEVLAGSIDERTMLLEGVCDG